MKPNCWHHSLCTPVRRSSAPSAMTRSFTSVMKYSLLFLHLFIVSENKIDASCIPISTLIKCTNSMITDNELSAWSSANDLHVQNYHGSLTTVGHPESEISSIQFQDSTITKIQPKFFHLFTNGNLKYLTLNRVSGPFQLNSVTLGGLENVLLRLEVNDHKLQDMGDIGNFKKLEWLKLVRADITKLPRGFGRVSNHLNELDVSNNRLTWLPWDTLAKRIEDVYFNSLRVGNNPWHCDCRLKPIVTASMEAKRKVSGLKCASPPELAGQTLDVLAVDDICTSPPEPEVKPPPAGGGDAESEGEDKGSGSQPSGGDEASKNNQAGDVEGSGVTSAGTIGLSTEVIVVIVAMCVVLLLIIFAVIAYIVRRRNARKKSSSGKPSSFQSNSYCAVVENPEEGRVKHSRKMASHTRGKYNVNEHEPLTGTGYNGKYPDHRL